MPGVLRFLSIFCLIFKKRGSAKQLCQVFQDFQGYFFNILKRDKQKNFARYFEIRKYAFLTFLTVPGFLEFIRTLFLIFEKCINKNQWLVF